MHYATWASLQYLQMVNLREYKFCRLLTTKMLEEAIVSAKVIWCIAKHLNNLKVKDVFRHFKAATGHCLKELFDDSTDERRILEFCKGKEVMFTTGQKDGEDFIQAKEYNDSDLETRNTQNPEDQQPRGKKRKATEKVTIDLCD